VADYGAALLAAGVVVGAVMVVVVFVALLGVRFSARPPSPTFQRKIAVSSVVLGVIWLVFVPIAFMYGGGIVWIVGLLEGPLLIAMGWMQLRALRRMQAG
jgi:hypothetical protein